ncbi:methyltransferase, TIGR04325 family [Patescibacteria group bacterium]|nr:MAG: methyltransferase, TIGR04325 family [Patescibacteria group bacterium]
MILERVKQATQKVMVGEAGFERDSVLFDEVQHPFPVLAGLLRAVVENDNKLSVLDFGGSLGSSYFQCRNFLSVLGSLSWNVVEQPHFVRCGREYIESEQLKFYFSIDEVLRENKPNVILLSSVLQYLPDPYSILSKLMQNKINYLIIDRTPFGDMLHDVITVQHVPPSIYPASYPCRVFSKQAVIAHLTSQYETVAEFESDDSSAIAGGVRFAFGGMILRRK